VPRDTRGAERGASEGDVERLCLGGAASDVGLCFGFIITLIIITIISRRDG
jgi:hypothetical protein